MRDVDLAPEPRPLEPDDSPSGDIAEFLNLPVFPCRKDKAPACPAGFKSASRAPAEIHDLWRRYPGPLVGVATGAMSGIDVLDIDVKTGARGMEWFEAHRARLPETRVHRTASGGLHVLFRHLDGLRNSTSKIAPGVDVRADGGYIIWWPLERFQARGDLDALAEWPLWILPSLMGPLRPPAPPYPKAAPRPITDRAIEGVLWTVATAPEGQRNSIAYWAAHRLRGAVAEGKVTEGCARELLLDAAQQAGLSTAEVSRTFTSAMRGGRRG